MSIIRGTQYTRQFSAEEVPLTKKLYLSLDNITTWNANKTFAIINYNMEMMPTSGSALGGKGELIEWDTPPIPQQFTTFNMQDYDQALLTQLEEWQYDKVDLRLFILGQFWLRCRIHKTFRGSPYKRTARFTTRNRQQFTYGENLTYDPWDGTLTHLTYNNPFVTDTSKGNVYGDVS